MSKQHDRLEGWKAGRLEAGSERNDMTQKIIYARVPRHKPSFARVMYPAGPWIFPLPPIFFAIAIKLSLQPK